MTHTSDRIELVRRGIEAFNRREFERGLELLTVDPGFEWDTTGVLPDGRVYRGKSEIMAYWNDVHTRWHEFRIEPEEFHKGDDAVVMLGTLHGKGAESGVPITSPWHQVWRFRGETPVRCENYGDRAKALRAAGLSET
ncbi:MAG: nuclear transport factor 2 family protein [Solirubrobacterales bacterium]